MNSINDRLDGHGETYIITTTPTTTTTSTSTLSTTTTEASTTTTSASTTEEMVEIGSIKLSKEECKRRKMHEAAGRCYREFRYFPHGISATLAYKKCKAQG